MFKLAILDRDGVINRPSAAYVKSVEEWRPLPRSIESVAQLSKAGFKIAIATNQSAIGRGLFDVGELNAMHRKMNRAVEEAGGKIDAVFFCPHLATVNCECRKPKPGMLLDILQRFGLPATEAFMVGDNERDILAAKAANVHPYLVLTGNGMTTKSALNLKQDVEIFDDLSATVAHILNLNLGRASLGSTSQAQ
jgi:D-glycero-D-manno-heptose 1,7-bisphosphate phosphatase